VIARDDRPFQGSSIASYLKTEQGLEFTCQVIKDKFAWPYCELVINVQSLSNESSQQGIDLSSYDKIGLWIKHNHPNQPGTRIELHNFNSDYSVEGEINSLKYNTLEFSENHVPYPTWVNLNSFHVPTWWNSSHDLSLEYGGTDFSNIYTLAITTGGTVQAGLYRFTLERIEIKGKYFKTETLLLFFIAIWSLAAGYFIKRFSSANTNFEMVTQQKEEWEYKATSDPLTGVLNRTGLRKKFDHLSANDLTTFSLIFIDIDHFKHINDIYGHNVGDDILVQFTFEINNACRAEDILARWGGEEFLLLCPETTLSQTMQIAEKVRMTIEETHWPDNIKLTCSLGVTEMHDEDLNTFIERADKALYSAKNSGRNCTVSA
jgi:diguanylate cyclase (GGDEF)-like protein